jgi:hypothetical protein
MNDRPISSDTADTRDSIPRVQHIAYFQEVLKGIAEGETFDALRVRLRQAAAGIARRTDSRTPPSRVHDAYTFWSPTTEAVGELMRIGLVEHRPLPSKRENVDGYRQETFRLTPAGADLIRQSGGSESTFRGLTTPLLLDRHPSFLNLCETLAREPLFVPEYTEEDLVAFRDRNTSWSTALGEDAAGRMTETMKAGVVSKEAVVAQVKVAVAKRFPEGSEPTRESILKTVKAGLVAAALETRGIHMDAKTFDILAKWGSYLYLLNESRYVHGAPGGRMIWMTAEVTRSEGGTQVARRGLAGYGDAAVAAVGAAYREIADALAAKLGGNAVRYPHLEIFRVRALAAFRVRVNNPVIDKVIADVFEKTRLAPYRVELALGNTRWSAVSETPFRIGSKRYYVILVKPEGRDDSD